MGRTIHYQINNKSFIPTDEQQLAIYALTTKYLDAIEWTAEQVSLDFYNYHPNWEFLRTLKGKELTMTEGWKIVDLSIRSKVDSGYSEIQARKLAHSEGTIKFHRETILTTEAGKVISSHAFYGFTKVASNELNAHAVIRFILECSIILKDVEILLSDEGAALFCPLILKNGKAKPDFKSIQSIIKHWNSKDYRELLHGGNPAWDVTAQEKYFNSILERIWTFGDPNRFIRPITDEGYLADRKKFKSTKLSLDKGFDLQDLVGKFLANQQAESAKYYKDVKEFPILANIKSK